MSAINTLLASLKVEANVFHNGQYCGAWAVDTSGSGRMTFHVISLGQCYVSIGNDTVLLKEGDAIFFPNDSPHRAGASPNEPIAANQSPSLPLTVPVEADATGLVCGDFGHQHPVFKTLLRQLPNYLVVRSEGESASAEIINLMLQESRQSGQSANLLLNRLADCLFYLLLRDHKEFVGQSPIDYITQWRMTQAYRWLVDDGISTYDAALRTGYESEASFSKAFKRVMGMGPGKARKRHTALV